jgi:hypothetical protein
LQLIIALIKAAKHTVFKIKIDLKTLKKYLLCETIPLVSHASSSFICMLGTFVFVRKTFCFFQLFTNNYILTTLFFLHLVNSRNFFLKIYPCSLPMHPSFTPLIHYRLLRMGTVRQIRPGYYGQRNQRPKPPPRFIYEVVCREGFLLLPFND